jgi:hypothetical protein
VASAWKPAHVELRLLGDLRRVTSALDLAWKLRRNGAKAFCNRNGEAAMNDQFREEWAACGYCAHCASAAVLPAPPMGYRRAYHIMSAEYAISNIVYSRIKIAQFRDLNDPFELRSFAISGKGMQERLAKHNANVNEKMGVVCFSEDWIDPVLWSHYGSKHAGIALGFDLFEGMARKVSYTPNRIDFPAEMGPEEAVYPSISTKFKSWSYEREWRIFCGLAPGVRHGSLFFEPFSSHIRLREVILGPFCTLPFEATRELVNTHHKEVVTIKARHADKYYSVVPDEKTVPDVPATKPFSWPNFECPCPECCGKRTS